MQIINQMLQNTEWGNKKKKDNPKKPATQGTQDEEKTKQKLNPICIGHHHTQTRHTFMPQTTGGKDEPNIVFMREEYHKKLICKRKLYHLSLLLFLPTL